VLLGVSCGRCNVCEPWDTQRAAGRFAKNHVGPPDEAWTPFGSSRTVRGPSQAHQGAGCGQRGIGRRYVVLCPPRSVLSTAPQVSCDAMGWCERHPLVSLRPDPNSNPDANPHLELESSRVSPPHRP
jgi:hypothetical protein